MLYQLTNRERAAVADMAAFLNHCVATGEFAFKAVLRTVDHDVQGLAHAEPNFLPRTAGYAKKRPGVAAC